MNPEQLITKEYFLKRLVDLCLRSGLSGFPKNVVKKNILLKSAVLTLDKSGAYTENEINEKLKIWVNDISQIKGIDYITLRRMLVDEGYLTRNNDGSCYRILLSGPQVQLFDDTVDQIDVVKYMKTAREDIARRKREYMEKFKKQIKDN